VKGKRKDVFEISGSQGTLAALEMLLRPGALLFGFSKIQKKMQCLRYFYKSMKMAGMDRKKIQYKIKLSKACFLWIIFQTFAAKS